MSNKQIISWTAERGTISSHCFLLCLFRQWNHLILFDSVVSFHYLIETETAWYKFKILTQKLFWIFIKLYPSAIFLLYHYQLLLNLSSQVPGINKVMSFYHQEFINNFKSRTQTIIIKCTVEIQSIHFAKVLVELALATILFYCKFWYRMEWQSIPATAYTQEEVVLNCVWVVEVFVICCWDPHIIYCVKTSNQCVIFSASVIRICIVHTKNYDIKSHYKSHIPTVHHK